jgi:hypothetical protein
VATLTQKIAIADFLRELKASSSGWVHDHFPNATKFKWQIGYAAFTVSHSAIESVKAYIANQEEHHRQMFFQDELRALLKRHETEFDEKYIWDWRISGFAALIKRESIAPPGLPKTIWGNQ